MITEGEMKDLIASGCEFFAAALTPEQQLAMIENVEQIFANGVTPDQAILVVTFVRELMHHYLNIMGEDVTEGVSIVGYLHTSLTNAWCGYLEAKVVLPLFAALCQEASIANM